MSNRLGEKAPDDDHPLDMTRNMQSLTTPEKYSSGNKQSPNPNQSFTSTSGKRRGRSPNNMNASNVEISMDHGYLQNIDKMELQNQNYKIEIEKLVASREEEIQKTAMAELEIGRLNDRIEQLEMRQD